MQDVAVILAAAGSSTRFGNPLQKKVFAMLGGKAVWQHSATTFSQSPDVIQQILVVHPDDREMFSTKFAASFAMLGVNIVVGGEQRWQSVQNALRKLNEGVKFVAVHDAARPLVRSRDFDAVITAARKHGAAILGDPIFGTVKRCNADGFIESTVSRERLFQAQTPQVFRRDWIEAAYQNVDAKSSPTDDAMLMESLGKAVYVVPGSSTNIKITTRDDLKLAEVALKSLVR